MQAPPKTGKSIFCAQMADSLARGQNFLSWPNVKPWKVVYIQADAPPFDWHGQLKQLGLEKSPALTIDRATVGLCCLDSSIMRMRLRFTLKELGAQLVIWDAMEKLTHLDLNEKSGCQEMLGLLEGVFAGPRILVHHPRKLKEGGTWSNVDEVAGNHYLAGDASSLISLKKNGPLAGFMPVTGRSMDSQGTLTRDGQDYRWASAQPMGEGGEGSASPPYGHLAIAAVPHAGLPPGLFAQPAP